MVAQSMAVLPAPMTSTSLADSETRRVQFALLDVVQTVDDELFAGDAE